MKSILWILAVLAMPLAGAEQDPESPAPDLSHLNWLEGCWEGTGFGQRVSECWMRAPDGRLTGMFQIIDADGRQTLSEIFILDHFDDGPAIRLKHFNPDLTGWEEQEDFVVFPLRDIGPGFARFDGLSYRRAEDGRMIVEVTVTRDGVDSLQRLEFTRTGGR